MFKRKLTLILSFIFVFALCFAASCNGCKKGGSSDTGSGSASASEEQTVVSLNVTSLELTRYETAVISATVSDGSVVSFTSDNEEIASVGADGKVTAKNVGACDITASANGVTAKCRVIVSVSPYSASIRGVSGRIAIVSGGEFKAALYADFNGKKIEDKISYSVSLTDKADEGVATATVDENGVLTVKGVKAGETSFSVFAEIRGALVEKTIAVTVYASAVVIEPVAAADFERLDGAYKLTLITENGESGLKNEVPLDFGVQINGNMQTDAKVEFDINADYNSDFDKTKAEIGGNATEGYVVTAKARGNTVLTGKYTTDGKDVFVKINLTVRLPEREITDKIVVGRENGKLTVPAGLEGSLEEITVNGVTVSTAINGNTATLNKELMPDGGNEKVLSAMTIYTDKYCYNAHAEICTKILTAATDFDAFKMVDGAYKAFTGYYVLIGDVDFADYGTCTAIRDNSNPSNGATGFKGVLDGNGHKIKNVTAGTGGIFGHVGAGAVFKDIIFDNVHYLNVMNSTLLAHTIRDADLINVTVNVGEYDVKESVTSSSGITTTIKYDVGILSSRFLIESRLKNVTVNAAGHTIVNLFGHRCTSNEFTGVKITAAAYKLIGCNSDSANSGTEIKSLPAGVTFTAK